MRGWQVVLHLQLVNSFSCALIDYVAFAAREFILLNTYTSLLQPILFANRLYFHLGLSPFLCLHNASNRC